MNTLLPICIYRCLRIYMYVSTLLTQFFRLLDRSSSVFISFSLRCLLSFLFFVVLPFSNILSYLFLTSFFLCVGDRGAEWGSFIRVGISTSGVEWVDPWASDVFSTLWPCASLSYLIEWRRERRRKKEIRGIVKKRENNEEEDWWRCRTVESMMGCLRIDSRQSMKEGKKDSTRKGKEEEDCDGEKEAKVWGRREKKAIWKVYEEWGSG